MSNVVDIVVPVYRGEQETRACLESVLGSATELHRHVIVIDDASPEPAICAWLRELAGRGAIELLRHDANRGFVASVNEGMARHPGRDVVLLNSDTEVAPGWLDRLAACARRDPSIATATPFSNNATVCSYPRTLVPNPLPEGETTASLDAAMARANAGRAADIPTAVGFCMYIRRPALATVGPFDEARYGSGYGEEVDFCMRAGRHGLRNVIAGDVFVRHVGEVSFSGTSDGRRQRAQAIVDGLYPEFQVNLRRFLAEDPVAALRRRADLERLRRSPRRPRLCLGPEEAAAARAGGAEPLTLAVAPGNTLRLAWERSGEEFALWVPAGEAPALLDLLAWLAAGDQGAQPRPMPELDPRWLRAPAETVTDPGEAPDPGAEAARARIAELERELARIAASRSWRLTAPLRSVARRLRALLS